MKITIYSGVGWKLTLDTYRLAGVLLWFAFGVLVGGACG